MKRLLMVLWASCLLAALRADAQTPSILSQPQSATNNIASAADFTVLATNAATYQWYFQGTNSLTGSTNATLSLDDLSTTQAGSYTVVVTSSNSVSVTSAPPAVLTIVSGTILQWTIAKYADGSSSNFVVQLFDHDKPATVENFIHYITSGAYSNMFFDRDVTNFVLQGGDYVTSDRTTNGPNVLPVSTASNNFPSQVDSEFGLGPLIHNRFGTIAMALRPGDSNSASSAFFFNLVDNSTLLDAEDFTVFGRILYGTNSGSNILQYFNTLRAPSNGIYDGFSDVPTLPVNYDSTNAPTDASFFYCGFTFLTSPPVITNTPTLSITFPVMNAVFTNGGDLTVKGTASENVGALAEVYCIVNTLSGVNSGESETNAALGTTNWSLDLGTNEPGVYELTAYAQDAAGNLSAPVTEYFTNLAVITIITNVDGLLSTNAPLYLLAGETNTVMSEPPAGEQFVHWQIQGVLSLDPVQTFVVETNLTLEVTYVNTNLPPGLTITTPAPGSTVLTTNFGFTVSGTLPSSVTVTQLTVQLYSPSNAVTAALPATITGTTWSLIVSNVVGGSYTIVVVAEDSLGQKGLVTENFTELVPPVIVAQPLSLTVNTGSAAAFSVVASNAASYQWYFQGTNLPGATNASLSLDDVSGTQAGSYIVVVTSLQNIAVTSAPPAVLTIVPGTIIQWTISKYADGSSSNFLVELFDHDKPATVENFIHYITSGAYSNAFLENDSRNFFLLGGEHVTPDRTTNYLTIHAVSTGTNFPSQIDSEFNVGPLVHNTFGTLAALGASSSGFFFNMTNNTSTLDSQGYTVFGRILYGTNSGSNILQYFNTLSAPSNGLYDDAQIGLNSLPVNYDGTSPPTDASVFYCDFLFQTQPPVITNPPTVSITFPTPNEVITNTNALTATGTASDNYGGIAEVFCVLTPIEGGGYGPSRTNAATGTTNWSLALGAVAPGIYQLTAYAQDGVGNLSAPSTVYFTNLNTLPSGLAITYPAAGSVVPTTNAGLTISGTLPILPSSVTVTQLTVQLFAQLNAATAPLAATINGTNWSLAESNLAGGPYTIEVVAEDSAGQQGFVSETFTALVSPVIISQTSNLTVNVGSSADFIVVATAAASYQWELVGTGPIAGATNSTLALNNVSSNLSGTSYFVVVTAPDGETVTNTPATLTVVQGTIIQWTVSTYAGGGSSNFLVELFDHDKPATVQNFIHYVTSGAYSNTFFDRVTNSVLLGGDFVTADRTTNLLLTHYGDVSTGTNVFPSQVDSEFNLGPLIPNTFGTLAAQSSANPQAGPGGFFFNLADNSTNLDAIGYTVFGRVLSGTNSGSNVLQYFNTLSAPSNGLFANTNYPLPWPLPVNYNGTNQPKDDNVFYCDFTFPTRPPLETNKPTVAISFPATNEVFTNGSPLTVQGTAQDSVGLAQVFCVLTSSTGAYNNLSLTNAALGTTNWSLYFGILEPGVYQLTAYAQNGAGILSAPATEYFTNLATVTIITNVNGLRTTNAPQYPVPGQVFSATATPGPGQLFYSWNNNGVISLNPVQSFTVNGNVTLTATFVSTNASTGVTITSPASGQQALAIQYVTTVSGTLASTTVTQLTCQFFINSNSYSGVLPAAIAGTNWSLTVTNYPNASNYTVVALATRAPGQESFASAGFTLRNVEILTLQTNGGGTIVNTNFSTNGPPYLAPGAYTVKAVPAKGYVFYSWNNGTTTTLNPTNTFYIVSNLTLTATFVTNDTALGLAFTYPTANAQLTNGTFLVTGTLPVTLAATQLTCQLFRQSNGLSAIPQPVTLTHTNAKWTFPVTNLTPGPYSILAVVYDNKGNARLVTEKFNLLAKLSVGVQGKGTVTAGLNGKYLSVGQSYPIAATPGTKQMFAYWTGAVANSNSPSTTFVMSTNTVLTANFTTNLFPTVMGTYTGLFLDPSGVSPSNSGFLKITISSTGSFSGSLMFPSVTYPISYAFPYNGLVFLQAKNAFDSNYLDLALSVDLTNGTDTITGYIADQPASALDVWVSGFVLYRGVAAVSGSNMPAAGKYVQLVQPENANNTPVTSGYAAVTLAASGALTLAGVLPDNTAISQFAQISKNGIWPFYLVPSSYAKKGMIIGWQTNTPSGACDGQLFWYKPNSGLASNLISVGAAYAAPATNTQYQMLVAGGTSNALPVSSSRQFAVESPITSISLQTSGVLSGYIEVNRSKLAFKGAFVSPSEGGAGFIIQTNGQTEGFQIIFGDN